MHDPTQSVASGTVGPFLCHTVSMVLLQKAHAWAFNNVMNGLQLLESAAAVNIMRSIADTAKIA